MVTKMAAVLRQSAAAASVLLSTVASPLSSPQLSGQMRASPTETGTLSSHLSPQRRPHATTSHPPHPPSHIATLTGRIAMDNTISSRCST